MSIKYFEKLLKSPRSSNDTSRLGYSSTKEGESSKTTEERINKGKNNKPAYHFCGKKGHTSNVCRSKKPHQHDKSKNANYYHKCKKQGHQAHECKTRTIKTPRFEGHYHNCKKYGHRSFECKSNPMWTLNQPIKTKGNENHYY